MSVIPLAFGGSFVDGGTYSISWTVEGTKGETGPQGSFGGPQGPQGPYPLPNVIQTFSNVLTYSVNHNSGIYPFVQLIDNIGDVFIPEAILHTSTYSFDLTFATESSGSVVVGGAIGPQGSNGGVLVGTVSPANSGSTGTTGEIRVNDGGYMYIHNGVQWLRSSMTFSTF